MSRPGRRLGQALRRGLGGLIDRGVIMAWRAERWLMRATGRIHRGVQALAFTPAGELILLELRYLPGWHLPGGRRRRSEPALAAILRELREELGAFNHGAVVHIATIHELSRGIRCEIDIFRVDHCVLPQSQRFNVEVRQVRSWPLDSLPDRAAVARDRLARLLPQWPDRGPDAGPQGGP
jgi:8-oxo-dGTP pyrophosphatase MutT (NUDIX family)